MMTSKSVLAALLAACSLGACGPQAAPNAQAPETTLTTETAQSATAAPPAEGVPTPQTLVGRWGDNGDCTKDIVINADGSFSSYTGGAGRWTLDGDVMSMTGSAGTFQVRVAIVNGNTLMIGNPDGTYGMSQRC